MNTTLKTITLAAAASMAISAYAGDKEILDLLVKKGTITADERGKLLEESKAKSSAAGTDRVFPKEDVTKRLTISGYFQTQYESFMYDDTLNPDYRSQSGFLARRLYIEFLADVGEGISGNVVFDMSGNVANSIDRAMGSITGSLGTLDIGYRKVAWGYEETTLSSLFKASSSKLFTVERGITNRYWNESEKNGADYRSDGSRLGFGAQHMGLHYSSPATPQGLEFGASVVNAAQGFNNYSNGTGSNDVGLYANAVFNYKVSDFQKYAVGLNLGTTRYFSTKKNLNTDAKMTGYNPFVQAQLSNLTVYAEYLVTKVTGSDDANNVNPGDHTPKGINTTLAYKFSDNWEGVARYTHLDTDGRGQYIADGVRNFASPGDSGAPAPVPPAGIAGSRFDKSNAIYFGLNYYFTLSYAGSAVYGPNAKFQIGVERANFSDTIANDGTITTGAATEATVDTLRAQFQVSF